MANSEFVDRSEEIVTEPFVAVSVACWVALDPTVTLPKMRVAGETPSCGLALATPFPATFISRGESVALLMTVRMPEVCPKTVGVKITGNRTLAPGLICAGKGNSPNEKALPWTDMEVILSVLLPVFESWKEKELELPICTLLKPCLQGSHCNCCAQAGTVANPQSRHAIRNRGKHRMN